MEYLGSLRYARTEERIDLYDAAFGGGRFVASEGENGMVYTPNYYITDHLGSNRAIVAGGQVVENVNYQPFGSTWNWGFFSGGSNTYFFNGKEGLLGSEFLDYGARMYANFGIPGWTSPDPLTEMYYSTSPYSYVGNNPVSYIDPDGCFRTRFGAWIYKLFNGGDAIYKDSGGEYFVSTNTTQENDGGDVTVSAKRIFDRSGRNEGYDLEALEIAKARLELQKQIWHCEKYNIPYYISNDPYEIWSNAVSNAAMGVMPTATLKSVALLSRGAKAGNAATKGGTSLWPAVSGGKTVINGVEYTAHALERMQPVGTIMKGTEMVSRGVPISAVENAIKYGKVTPGKTAAEVVRTFENVRVVTNPAGTKVITVMKLGH